MLYVNQNTRNFQMFRYGRRWHVFINHGESDKMYMTTNQYKAYDYALIAGDAARERLSRVLWDYDIDRRTIEIGRPQADHYSGTLPYTPDERTVVLYAPTWEGDRPSAHYGSIATPRRGARRGAAGDRAPPRDLSPAPALRGGATTSTARPTRRIIAALAAANAADPGAHHVYDDGPELGWQLAAADVADRRHLGDGLRPARRRQAAPDHASRRSRGGDRHARLPVGVRVAGCRRRPRRSSRRPSGCSATPRRSRVSRSG